MSRVVSASWPPIAAMAVLALSLSGCIEPPPPSYSASAAPQVPNVPAPPPTPECREMRLSVMIGNQPQDVFGTACRQPDGSWRIRE